VDDLLGWASNVKGDGLDDDLPTHFGSNSAQTLRVHPP